MSKSDEALIFDLKRFAVHDGSGIRTTVFFKGCPLRCAWCQNPEGLSGEQRPIFLKSRCIHCISCEEAAQKNQLIVQNGTPSLNYGWKGSWSDVIHACPTGAIVYDSAYYSTAELLERIRADRVFYRDTGGVTFSGGEPLIWAAFLKNIMEQCQKEGIRTALETSLAVPRGNLEMVLPYCDEIFADLKVFDSALHRKCTGVGNEAILENMRVLLTSEKKDAVTVRTPLIPGLTAEEENIKRIAHFIAAVCPGVKYELLNCNTLAAAKYEMCGRKFELEGTLRRFSEEEMEAFCRAAEENNCIEMIREKKAEVN